MKVSVCIIAYNVESFIAEAVDGALAQQTDFDFEVVVGEDCSQDSTREILADYQRRFPDRIKIIFRKNRLGMVRNFAETVLACKGQYIAMLDGDDFWNSPHKLQKQADLLDANRHYSGCYHNVCILHEGPPRTTRLQHTGPQKPVLDLNDLAMGNPICSGSMVFRAALSKDFPDWYFTMPMQDWPLYVLNAHHGPVGYIHEMLSTYRIHSLGDWNRQDRVEILRRDICAAQKMNAGLNYSLDTPISRGIANSHYKIAKLLMGRNERKGAELHAREAMKHLRVFRLVKALGIYLQCRLFH